MSDQNDEEQPTGLERKKEAARKRTKAVRDSANYTRRKRERSLTPGVRIVGSKILERDAEKTERTESENRLRLAVTEYLLRKGGFEITEELLVDKISKKSETEDVMNIQIARIMGLHERWGLDRKFVSKSIFAHRFEDGTVIEHSLVGYGGYVSRTYYVVEGNEFRAFAQRNFRKQSD